MCVLDLSVVFYFLLLRVSGILYTEHAGAVKENVRKKKNASARMIILREFFRLDVGNLTRSQQSNRRRVLFSSEDLADGLALY